MVGHLSTFCQRQHQNQRQFRVQGLRHDDDAVLRKPTGGFTPSRVGISASVWISDTIGPKIVTTTAGLRSPVLRALDPLHLVPHGADVFGPDPDLELDPVVGRQDPADPEVVALLVPAEPLENVVGREIGNRR